MLLKEVSLLKPTEACIDVTLQRLPCACHSLLHGNSNNCPQLECKHIYSGSMTLLFIRKALSLPFQTKVISSTKPCSFLPL